MLLTQPLFDGRVQRLEESLAGGLEHLRFPSAPSLRQGGSR
jgi:hypothetical protein